MQQQIWFHKYRIIKLLGRGGTAKVYLAEHIKLNSYRAIKFISNKHPLYDLQRKEAFILKNLKHSCIPIIYDIEENEEGSYIVEQYLEGDTLKDYVNNHGIIPDNIIILFATQLCDLIHYLHSIPTPILFLDLKPENILVEGNTLKLIDFGSAMYRDEQSVGQSYYGTKGYAAPELYSHNIIDERCDVYGIGMLMYFMVYKRIPNLDQGEIRHIDFLNGCSKQLKYLIDKCLKYNPSQRYASVSQLKKELSAIYKKSSFQSPIKQVMKIAVAGSQHRIGVTHLSFQLCNYFIHQRKKCIYLEKNDSGCIWNIKNCYEGVITNDGTYCLAGIIMIPKNHIGTFDLSEYQILVQDYGVLSDDKLNDFLEADLKIVILGAKDWEIAYTEQVLNQLTEYKEIVYLFNYLDGKQFLQIMKSMRNTNCYRLPYEPNPFAKLSKRYEQELFRELNLMLYNKSYEI